MQPEHLAATVLLAIAMIASGASSGADDDGSRVVADLDTAYQAAVEHNDWQAMDRNVRKRVLTRPLPINRHTNISHGSRTGLRAPR